MTALGTQAGASRVSRRIAFQGLGALGVALALAGCGGGDDGGGGDSGGDAPAPESGAALAATSEVPVGGGLVLTDEQLVLVQPTEGTFLAYSAVCTHQGTLINEIVDGVMVCPNHGSEFSIEDGSVQQGPATTALPTVEVTVDGDQIVAA